MIWRSHQRCESCGWAGVTRAHRLNIISGLLYIGAALVLVVLDATGAVNVRRVLTGPVVVVALLWFYGLPLLIWRRNACPACGKPMKRDLLSGHAPRSPPPR